MQSLLIFFFGILKTEMQCGYLVQKCAGFKDLMRVKSKASLNNIIKYTSQYNLENRINDFFSPQSLSWTVG